MSRASLTVHKDSFLLQRAAVIAGVAYLIAIFVTPYGWINPMIVIGDPMTTFNNMFTQDIMLRLAISCWLIVIVADIVVAWALYYFFLPVDKPVSLLAMSLRLVFASIMAVAVVQWLYALQVITAATGLSGEALEAAQHQAMFYFISYEYVVNIAFMIFGLHVGLIGYLVWRSTYVPRIIGFLLMFACIGYQIDTFASVLSDTYAAHPHGFTVTVAIPAFFSEFMFTLWLLIRGRKLKGL